MYNKIALHNRRAILFCIFTKKSNKGHEYKFKSSDQSKLKRAMDKLERLQKDFERDMERAQKEFGESLNDLISNADILLKK